MSEASSGVEIQRRCVSIILQHFIGCDASKTKQLAVVLRDDDVIKKDERKKLGDLVNAGNCSEAVENMINSAAKSDDGLKYLVEAVKEEDLKLDEKIPRVLHAVFSDDPADYVKTSLISFWEELLSFRQEVTSVIKDIWPEEFSRLTETEWPLDFVIFCIETQDQQKVEDFISAISFLKTPMDPAENRKNSLTMNPTDRLRHETTNDQEQLSDEFGSFVVIDREYIEDKSIERPTEPLRPSVLQQQESFGADDFEDTGQADNPCSEPTDPMKISTASDELINKKIEDASRDVEDSPQGSIHDDAVTPNPYVSEDSSLSHSATEQTTKSLKDSLQGSVYDGTVTPAPYASEDSRLLRSATDQDPNDQTDPTFLTEPAATERGGAKTEFSGEDPTQPVPKKRKGGAQTELGGDGDDSPQGSIHDDAVTPNPYVSENSSLSHSTTEQTTNSQKDSLQGSVDEDTGAPTPYASGGSSLSRRGTEQTTNSRKESLDATHPPENKSNDPPGANVDEQEHLTGSEQRDKRESVDLSLPKEDESNDPLKNNDSAREDPADAEQNEEICDLTKTLDPTLPQGDENEEPSEGQAGAGEDSADAEQRHENENQTRESVDLSVLKEDENKDPLKNNEDVRADPTDNEQKDKTGNQTESLYPTLPQRDDEREPPENNVGAGGDPPDAEQREKAGGQRKRLYLELPREDDNREPAVRAENDQRGAQHGDRNGGRSNPILKPEEAGRGDDEQSEATEDEDATESEDDAMSETSEDDEEGDEISPDDLAPDGSGDAPPRYEDAQATIGSYTLAEDVANVDGGSPFPSRMQRSLSSTPTYSSSSVDYREIVDVELRAVFTRHQAFMKRGRLDGWTPVVIINGVYYYELLHRSGYYSAVIKPRTSELSYTYALMNGKRFHMEYLPVNAERVVRWKEGEQVFDVACFTRLTLPQPRKKWRKLMNGSIGRYLPTPESLHLDDEDLSPRIIKSWIKAVVTGWKFADSNFHHKVGKTNMEGKLAECLEAIGSEQNKNEEYTVRHVMCSLAVISALHHLNCTIENPKLFTKICNGLQIHRLPVDYQLGLFERVCGVFTYQPRDLFETMEFFFAHVKAFIWPECIFSIPLYWIFRSEGQLLDRTEINCSNIIFKRAMLPLTTEDEWNILRTNIHVKNFLKELKDLGGEINEISGLHPWIVDTFQYFLSGSILIELIRENNPVVGNFSLDSVFTQLLKLLQPVNFSADPQKISEYRKKVAGHDVSEYLRKRFATLSDPSYIEGLSEEQKRNKAESACRILTLLCKTVAAVVDEKKFDNSQKNCILWLITMANSCLSWIIKLGMRQHCKTSANAQLKDILVFVTVRISEFAFLQKDIDVKEIMFYNNLLNKPWQDSAFREMWVEELTKIMEKSIDDQWPDVVENFLQFYLVGLNDVELCKSLDRILQQKAAKVAESVMNSSDVSDTSWLCMASFFKGDRSNKVFADVFKQAFKKYHDGDDELFRLNAIRFLAECPVALRFYRAFDQQQIARLFSSRHYRTVKQIDDVANTLLEEMSKGCLTIEELRVIIKHEEQMKELLILKKEQRRAQKPPSAQREKDLEIEGLFKRGKSTLKMYKDQSEALNFFLCFCRGLDKDVEVNCTELQDIIGRKPSHLEIRNWNARSIKPDEKREILLMHHLKDSQLIYSKCTKLAKEVYKEDPQSHFTDGVSVTTWNDILSNIWMTGKERILNFIKEVDNATLDPEILVEEFKFTEGKKDAIMKELLILYKFSVAAGEERAEDKVLKSRASKRARQLFYVFELQRKQEVLKWFAEFQQKNNLKSYFEPITRFQGSYKRLSEKEFKKVDDVLKTSSEEFEVLQAFTERQELIDWLQSSKMADEGQVRGLCMVAIESSSNNHTHADKWSFLRDAVAGFEALIFHLDAIQSREDLMKRCRSVWQKVEADRSILDKWSDVGRDIAWYKENEKWYGSEDQAASYFAQKANKSGIYTIGNFGNIGSTTATLKDSIQLVFSQKPATPMKKDSSAHGSKDNELTIEASNFPEKIDIDYLHDIESKLMLIAGDGDGDENRNEIKQFVSVLHAMESLAKAYVDLVNAGFMLFSDWKVIASLKPSEGKGDMMCEHILMLQISFKPEVRTFTKTANIQDLITLSDLLRDALKRWNKHVSEMRRKHYFLNEYSIQQIKDLCGQLGKTRQTQIGKQAHALLSELPRTDIVSMIQESLVEATAATDNEEIEEQDTDIDEAAVSDQVALVRQNRRAVRHLVNKENTSEALAKAAVQAEGHKEYVKCCNWILLHEYDEELVDELSTEFDQAAGFIHDQHDVQEDAYILQNRLGQTLESMISLLQERAAENGLDLLQAVKTIYVGYLNNTTALTLQDYLSVNHLGKFLTILHSKMEEIQPSPFRVLPNSFKKGVPNFILSENQGVVPLILSLFAKQPCLEEVLHEKPQAPPLPSPAEVLICSDEVTADEVERFMLQAMCKHPTDAKLIFCLAYTENLDFNVSKALEGIFDKLSHDAHVSNDYQLVIISSDPHHYVTTCFDKHRVENLPDYEDKDIDTYVKFHMTKDTELKQCKAQVVCSRRSGVGKSLHVKRIAENLPENCQFTTVRLPQKDINMTKVVERLFKNQNSFEAPQLIHIDLTPAVENGIDKFFFDLIILGMIRDSFGNVWRRRENHSYVIEVTKHIDSTSKFAHTLELLPTVQCLSPVEVLERLGKNESEDKSILMMDEKEYQSDVFQRPYQYLLRHEKNKDLEKFDYQTAKDNGTVKSSRSECIQVLFRNCGITDPSWAQLKYFVSFLNVQLVNCEKSVFCLNLAEELRGLKKFAVKFMVRMAQDFATPSLVISDQSSKPKDKNGHERNVVEDHQMRRKWEENEHPYVFFNDDGITMSFINVNIDKNGNLLDKNGAIVEQGVTSRRLVEGLQEQRIDLGHNFHKLPRHKMIESLCLIMGVNEAYDPDPTYELTTDNVLKMIAIYMRFRCNIPVIIMGETGCGKTRMVEFMSSLQAGKQKRGSSMKTLKIHGGIGVDDIFKSVLDAVEEKSSRKILFYDEANTTTAIYAIKEVMCDLTIDGDSFAPGVSKENTADSPNLQIVAACNPYKRLSDEALAKLEASGLGYRVAASETKEKLGNIAMRTLVYRVVSLPPSIQPFVWDFGQLADETEKIYIEKMVSSKLQSKYLLSNDECNLIVSVLSRIQAYMKKRGDECRYVSLRDVERTIKLFKWFYKHNEHLFEKVDSVVEKNSESARYPHPKVSDSLRCLIHAVGITYHVSLESRKSFRDEVSDELLKHGIEFSGYDLQREYTACQTAFHHDLKTDDNIAWNEALRENVFLMAVCADVKLPLYLIGKPGSSKSLAKSIVEANMQGPSSGSSIFKKMKKVEIVSYQCSALTNASGIKKIFKNAAEWQKERDLKKFTAMVVLDEIGLAEDSPNMPLKILHPLLECGNAKSGSLTEYKESDKVAFVGISNWALDPAKMNRGIFVARNTPDENDLLMTATGIFQGSMGKVNQHRTLLENFTKTYLHIYKEQRDQYFGLRDYYCVIKMIQTMCIKDHKIVKHDIAYVLARNFSGGKEYHAEALKQAARDHLHLLEGHFLRTSVKQLVKDNIASSENRFLLLLTAEHSSINLLHYIFPDFDDTTQVIFGSSFPGDHTYTAICRNMNQIKLCMERGKRVVLLHMNEVHESLYDVLNQYYIRFGGQRYVAIGLGNHRVWTRIHKDFRLIIIEKRDVAQNQYPIPLINRLEKHHLLSSSLLDANQLAASKQLTQWMEEFVNVGDFDMRSSFIGSHEDTASSVVLAYNDGSSEEHEAVMLQVASADSVYRLPQTRSGKIETERLMKIYMEEQTHDCLFNLLLKAKEDKHEKVEIFEIVSFSNILTEDIRKYVELKLNLIPNSVMLLSLQQFKVEQEYIKKLDDFFKRCEVKPEREEENVAILLVQTPQAQRHGQLIECAKHYFMNRLREVEKNNVQAEKVIVAFILSTDRFNQRSGDTSEVIIQQTRKCKTIYVDELRHTESNPSTTLISSFYGKSLSDILEEGKALVDRDGSTNSHVLCLLQDCISEAMSKVTSSVTKNGRQLERIRELRQICMQTSLGEVGHGFLKILLQKMMSISKSENQGDKLKWIVDEACSQEHLQEGGTFGKTIHLYLKRCLAHMLAYIVSIIDENDNMSILASPEQGMEWKFELWLQIFSVFELKEPPLSQLEYTVKTPKRVNLDFTCKFPFSFFIHERFMYWYKAAKEAEVPEQFFYHNVQNEAEKVLSKVFRSWNPSNGIKMMQTYAYDLMKFQFEAAASSQEELSNLVTILFECSKKKWNELGRDVNGVLVTFHTFMQKTEHLSVLSSIFNICPEIMQHTDGWIEDQAQHQEFKIHEYALKDLLDWAHKQAGEIEDEKTCMNWMNVCSQMKKTYKTLVDMIKSEERRKELKKKWKPLALLDTLLMHLLPWNRRDPGYLKYVSVVVNQAMRLFKALETMELYSKEILKIITTVLRKCYEDLELKLKMKWGRPNCVCGTRIQVPIEVPCGGFICQKCADLITDDSRTCPRCTDPLPEDFDKLSTTLSPDNKKELQRFQANCTGFFLEYLQEFCFDGQATEMDADAKILAVFEHTLLPEELQDTHKVGKFKLETTKLDLNVATKSSIFHFFLKLRPSFIKDKFDKIFLDAKFSDDTLVLVVLKAFENECETSRRTDKDSSKYHEELLENSWVELLGNKQKLLTVNLIQHVANVRYALSNLVKCVQKRRLAIKKTQVTPGLILRAKDICSDDGDDAIILRRFISKMAIICYGKQWLEYMNSDKELKKLICVDLIPYLDKDFQDHCNLLGQDYSVLSTIAAQSMRTARDEFGLLLSRNEKGLCPENVPRIMAALQIRDRGMIQQLQQNMKNQTPEFDLLRKSDQLVQNLASVSDLTMQQGRAVHQAVVLAVSIVLCKLPMMQELYDLVMEPESMERCYWPAMPESLYHYLNDAMVQEQPYSCPNGHVYYIGDCTYPSMMSQCPECGGAIGGILHIKADGNQRLPTSDRSQQGYQLHTTKMGVDNPADRTTQQAVAVMQFFIHACMMMAMTRKENEILKIVGKESKSEGGKFLAQKLQENVEQLSQGLGCNVDESIMVLHQILAKIVSHEQEEFSPCSDWTTKERRKLWENEFQLRYLRPIFREADDLIFDAKKKLVSADNVYDLHKFLQEDVPLQSKEQRLTCFHPVLWKSLKESTSSHLLHCIADSPLPGGVLGTILKTPNLHLVKDLPNTLKLQEIMIQRYQKTHDMDELDETTIDQVLKTETYEMGQLIESYITLWNSMCPMLLVKYSNDKNLSEYIRRIDKSSPITMALPSSRGRGKCAKVLAEYLIDLQNDFLQNCKEADYSLEGIAEVEVPKLLPSHFVCVDKRKDLLSMIQLHTAYSISTAEGHVSHHHISYNISALEKQAKEKHALYKKKISKDSLPCIKYLQDVGIGSDWEKVNRNVSQVPLTAQIRNEVDEMVQRVTLADVCEGVRTLTQAISFLAKVKTPAGDSSKKLRDYLEGDLMLSSTHLTMIPKSAMIRHTLALYQNLSCHRAVRFVQQGLDPYKASLQTDKQEKITDVEVLQQLKQAFEHMDLNSLQEHLNEMLIKVPDYREDWSLIDIFPDLTFIEETPSDSWYDRLPNEICFKHVSDLFRLSVLGIPDLQ